MVDVLVGNPPWLAYRHMPSKLQRTYRALALERGFWVGGGSATHQDLSDLFVARSVEQYLRVGGRFAFVMPYAALSRFQFAGFRTGDWRAAEAAPATRASFTQPEEFVKVKPPPFPVPCSVVSGRKARAAVAMPKHAVRWSGRLSSHSIDWAQAERALERRAVTIEVASHGHESPYRRQFKQGATLVPRVLIKVVERAKGPLGGPAHLVRVESARSPVEKEPWKSLEVPPGRVERQFVRRTHLGATILPFRATEPELAVLPWVDGALLDGDSERLDEFPGLAKWWCAAEEIWTAHKGQRNKLSLRDRIDYQRGVTSQLPASDNRVVYTRSGQYLAACLIMDSTAVIEQTLYWAPVDTVAEGRFLCGVLNSQTLARMVLPFQSRGQHNPRDFAMSVFEIPIPKFDASNPLHARLSTLAEEAEAVAESTPVEATWQFQKARRVVRESLISAGLMVAIDAAVAEVLTDVLLTRDGRPRAGKATPDLIAALRAATGEGAKRPPAVKRRRAPRLRETPKRS